MGQDLFYPLTRQPLSGSGMNYFNGRKCRGYLMMRKSRSESRHFGSISRGYQMSPKKIILKEEVKKSRVVNRSRRRRHEGDDPPNGTVRVRKTARILRGQVYVPSAEPPGENSSGI